MFRPTDNHSKVLGILFFFLFSSGAIANAEHNLPDLPQSLSFSGKAPIVTFQQAVKDDLAGYHSEARQKYDELANSALMGAIAVPSAVNLVALGRYDDAHKAFSLLKQNGNGRERDYALLWDLWLTARTWQGGRAALEKALTDKTTNYKWFSTYELAIASIYAGKGSAKDIFPLIDGIAFDQAEEKADVVTQAVFFVGGYYRYVMNQPQKAQELYDNYASRLNINSLERNLIIREQQSLRAPK